MNDLTRTLLAGVALCALTGVSAAADSTIPLHVTARHGGRVINKTKLHNRGITHIYSTFSVFTYVPESNYRKTQILPGTFTAEEYEPCHLPVSRKMKAPKKGLYGKIGIVTQTYDCGDRGKAVLYGNSYKLTDRKAQGKTDRFVSKLTSLFIENTGTKYKGTLTMDVNVLIDSLREGAR